jgi:hypothetical protein
LATFDLDALVPAGASYHVLPWPELHPELARIFSGTIAASQLSLAEHVVDSDALTDHAHLFSPNGEAVPENP